MFKLRGLVGLHLVERGFQKVQLVDKAYSGGEGGGNSANLWDLKNATSAIL